MSWLTDFTDWTGLTNHKGTNNAINAANAALEASKMNAAGVNADTQSLMNPNINNQIKMATDAVMGQFGASGNLYSSGARNAVADRAQAIASNDWARAAQQAMAMQQGNQQITAGIGANKIAGAKGDGLLGDLTGALGAIFG